MEWSDEQQFANDYKVLIQDRQLIRFSLVERL